MIHEWQRVIKHARDHPNRKNIQVGYRISEVCQLSINSLVKRFLSGIVRNWSRYSYLHSHQLFG